MKQITVGIVVGLTGVVLLTSCGKKQETSPAIPPATTMTEPAPVPTAPTPSPVAAPTPAASLVDLAANARSAVEQAMALAKEGKYQEALMLLQQKSAEVQSNPEGKILIDNAIAQIKQMMADAATKAATEKLGGSATKALGGFGK
jgi:hypothetical protein